MMQADEVRQKEHWLRKFHLAFRGVQIGLRGESSFFVHAFMAAAVVGFGLWLRPSLVEWCLLIGAIFLVIAAEMFNSALEWLAKAVTDQHDTRVETALDVSSGAVLMAATGAAIVGAVIFLYRLGVYFELWG